MTAITERGLVLRHLRAKLAYARRMRGTPEALELGGDRVRMLEVLIEEIEQGLHLAEPAVGPAA
jgi:hypothetical protein